MRQRAMVWAVLSLVLSGGAWAHHYIPDDGSHTGADKALYVRDISLSQVIYHDVTPEAAQVWLSFDGKAGQSLYFQLGVPFLTRLEDYRPAIALVGPGLDGVKPPFAIPDGLDAQTYDSAGVTPVFFDEPFTGTQSWIMFEKELPLPQDGRYYLVAYDPAGEPGKLWMALGRGEKWTFKDVLTLYQVQDKVRTFHEVQRKPMPLFTFTISAISRVMRVLFFFV